MVCAVLAGVAELDPALAGAVETYWSTRAALDGRAAYHRLASDVWDLLRPDGD
jgi:hypothetical protein